MRPKENIWAKTTPLYKAGYEDITRTMRETANKKEVWNVER